MATAHAHIHLSAKDAPAVTQLESGACALWLTARADGPVISGTREQLLEVRRAIGRFLFPDEFEQPEPGEQAA